MSYFGFPTDGDGNLIVSDQSLGDWMEYMAEQQRMQTVLLLKLMDFNENTTLEELEDGN